MFENNLVSQSYFKSEQPVHCRTKVSLSHKNPLGDFGKSFTLSVTYPTGVLWEKFGDGNMTYPFFS